MDQLHYLTVQDLLWVNLQVTRKVNHFNHARLEEGTYYQYAYGESNSLIPQAARFLTGFLRMHPFDAGNEATIFIALHGFLGINGHTLDLGGLTATEWLDQIVTRQKSALSVLTAGVKADHHHHAALSPEVRGTIRDLLAKYESAVVELNSRSDK